MGVVNGWGIVLALLGLALLVTNGVLIYSALRTRTQVQRLRGALLKLLALAIDDLSRFEDLRVSIAVKVDDVLQVKTRVPIKQTVDVNVQGVVPVKETIRTAIQVTAPLLGRIPVDVEVPVDLRVPVNLNVPVRLDQEIPIELNVPVKLSIPVEVDLRATEIGEFLEQVVETLRQLQDLAENGVEGEAAPRT
jgi:hypothetical protein